MSDQAEYSAQQFAQMLQASPAFQSLAPHQQVEMSDSMAKVFGYLDSGPGVPARQLAPNFDQLRNPGGDSGNSQAAPQQPAPTPATNGGGGTQAPIDRAPGATAGMLGAINFPSFVASLVQGTFQAIVDASIQQMEAYSNLLAETAKTVDSFMQDNVSDDMARDHLADNYGDIFQRNLGGTQPTLGVVQPPSGNPPELPSFLQGLGFDSVLDIDEQAVEEVIVPEARHTLAEMRHQTLATMVMMGINRVVVDDGEINAKLIFNVDANETMNFTFDESKPTNWNLAGTVGRNPFGANGIVVTTTNINTQADLSVRAELTGEVKIRFRSETFPLERFADSAAIQLINTRAKVPEQRASIEGEVVDSTRTEESEGATSQASKPSRAVVPTNTGVHIDPWAPRRR